MEKRKHILAGLLLTFMKVGLFTFGGGYAMISMITYNCVEKKKWIDQDEMMNLTVIAESTPGPIAINAATYIGYKQAGFVGSIFSTLGIIIPSFTIIYIISLFLKNFMEYEIIAAAFAGIKIAVGILILDAAFGMIKKMPKKTFPIAVMLCSFAVMLLVNILALPFSSVELMIFAALISLVHTVLDKERMRKGGGEKGYIGNCLWAF